MQTIQVSEVLKPRGLKGELKCREFSCRNTVHLARSTGKNTPLRAPNLTTFSVKKCYTAGGYTYLTLDGIYKIELAEPLRGAKIFVDRAEIKIAADEILPQDLLGFSVENIDGKPLGVVQEVNDFGAGVVLEIGEIMLAYEDDFIVETNMKTRKLVVKNYEVQNAD